MKFSEFLDTYAGFFDGLLTPVTDDPPPPSPERTEPDNPQVWEVFKTDALVRPEPETVRLPRLSLADLAAVINSRERRARRVDQGVADLFRDVLADADLTITNPYAKETTMPAPAFEPYDELDQDAHNYLTGCAPAPTARSLLAMLNDDRLDARRVANLVRDVRDAEAPGHTVQIDGVKIAKCDTRGLTDEERASYERGLREGRLDNSVVRAEVVGSAEWLRDLADRLQQHNADRGGVLDPEHGAETPYLLREHADQVAPAWEDLSEAERAHSLDRHLEVYRAGRNDQEANRG